MRLTCPKYAFRIPKLLIPANVIAWSLSLVAPVLVLALETESPSQLTKKAEQANMIIESEAAKALCDRAIKLDKNFAPAYFERAESFIALGLPQEAIKDLTYASQFSNFRHNAIKDRAAVYMALKNYRQVIADMSSNINGGGTNGDFLLRANAYEALGRPDLAAKDFTEALKRKPNDYETLYQRSNAYLQSGQLKQALADCNQMVKLDSKTDECLANASLFARRSKVYLLLGQKKEADADALRAAHIEKAAFGNSPFRSSKSRSYK